MSSNVLQKKISLDDIVLIPILVASLKLVWTLDQLLI